MRWGVAGLGWVARDHFVPAARAAGHRIAGVADPSPAARARAEEWDVPCSDTVEALLAGGGLDALYVATPNHAHAAPAIAALRAGVPVLCEKPMAAALGDAERMAVAARESGTLLGTAFDQRHHPAHTAMADAIRSGAIGRPVAVRIVYACWLDPLWVPPGGAPDEPNWRADPQAAGGGATIDLALHGLDLVHRLTGEAVERLHVTLQRRTHDYPVDDGGVLSGRTAGGVLLTSHVAYNCPDALPRRRLEVLGERGLMVAQNTMGQTAGGQVTVTTDTGSRVLAFDAARSPFQQQVEAFARAVAGGPHDFDAERDLALTRLFDGAHEEAKEWL